MSASWATQVALNGICPYFTMFPLDFPLDILERRAREGGYVLDPFCGRGTTNFAARLLGLNSLGVDSSPVAAAITASKLVATTVDEILAEARHIIAGREACQIPTGEFWRWAYHPAVLNALCRFREAFLEGCSAARIALRGIVLGALHGPKQKTVTSYFSNQCPRTYAPKPAYAARYWQSRRMFPNPMDVLAVIERRAKRYYETVVSTTPGIVRLADSRVAEALQPENPNSRFNWVITSPPYYGMRTYIPDQWLRNWFVGGPDMVDYTNRDQVIHSSPEDFVADLRRVWRNAATVCTDDARLVIRFGGITDRRANPLDLVKSSLAGSGWRIATIRKAGSAMEGKRQADTFLRTKTTPLVEYDVWARK